jgi:hypothetical protein
MLLNALNSIKDFFLVVHFVLRKCLWTNKKIFWIPSKKYISIDPKNCVWLMALI